MEDFTFELGRSASMVHNISLADDIFHQGRLQPFPLQRSRSTGSTSKYSYRESNSLAEKAPQLNEKLGAWKTESLDSHSSQWTSFRSKYSNSLQRSLSDSSSDISFRRCNPATESTKSKFKPKSTSPAPAKARRPSSKTSLKWLQFFTPALMKAPTMKLQDIRLRQRKLNNSNNNIGVQKSVLKRSVSCTYDRGPELLKRGDRKAKKFQEGSHSVYVKETQRSKRWRICEPFTSLNTVKAFAYPVTNCSATKQRVWLTEEEYLPKGCCLSMTTRKFRVLQF